MRPFETNYIVEWAKSGGGPRRDAEIPLGVIQLTDPVTLTRDSVTSKLSSDGWAIAKLARLVTELAECILSDGHPGDYETAKAALRIIGTK